MAATRTTPDTGVEIKPVELYGDDGGVPSLATVQGAVDALSTTLKAQLVNSRQMYYTPNGWERARTPTTFKTWSYAASTAETTIWTPAAGKKIRVLGMVVSSGASVTVT